jgi:hypothetical protein
MKKFHAFDYDLLTLETPHAVLRVKGYGPVALAQINEGAGEQNSSGPIFAASKAGDTFVIQPENSAHAHAARMIAANFRAKLES